MLDTHFVASAVALISIKVEMIIMVLSKKYGFKVQFAMSKVCIFVFCTLIEVEKERGDGTHKSINSNL